MVEQDLYGFILKEDNDSGHKRAMLTRWKKEYEVQYYLNASKSSDLSSIQNVWSPLKFHYNSQPHWDEEQAKQRILDIFEQKIKQEWINKLVFVGFGDWAYKPNQREPLLEPRYRYHRS